MNNKFSTKLKTTATIILILLMASVMLMANPVQPAQAQLAEKQPYSGTLKSGDVAYWQVDVGARLSFTPNPIGVGQTFLVNAWITPPPSSNRKCLDFVITITKPDGKQVVVTMNSYVDDGTIWFEYVADQVGEWKLKFDFLGMYYPAGRYYDGYVVTNTSGTIFAESAYYKPASTAEQTLVVQEEQVMSWYSLLPTDYWTRPILPMNREWYQIGGNWPPEGYAKGGAWQGEPGYYGPYITAPNTAHVVWKRLGAIAGVVGGETGQYGPTSGGGSPSVIFVGRCYQTYTKPGVGSVAACYDLRTGEIYYEIPTAQGGYTPQYIDYLPKSETADESSIPSTELLDVSGNRLIKINPYTGAVSGNYSVSGMGTILTYHKGHVLSVRETGWINGTEPRETYLYNWTTRGTTGTFANRIVSNISFTLVPSMRGVSPGGYGILGAADLEAGITVIPSRYWKNYADGGFIVAVSLKTGKIMWNVTTQDAPFAPGCSVSVDGVYYQRFNNGIVRAYDLYSSKELWASERTDYPWGYFGGYSLSTAYGLLYMGCYSGMYAFDLETGKIVWHYVHYATPFENPYTFEGQPCFSFSGSGVVADGKLYIQNGEHTATAPWTRGWSLHCINATTGEGLWKIMSPMSPGPASDGYMTASSSYDGYMYVFGKGKSATTVTTTPAVITNGATMLIQGTVKDQSPAQPGTACVSKESMALQMEYLHLQMPIGGLRGNETMTGVPVSLDALDSNGNWVHIGDVTTDAYSGTFGYTWEPEITGQYTVTATFMGDDSYGSSFTTTYVSVVEAPAASPTATPISFDSINSTVTSTIIGGVVAIIIAIAIVGALALRKRP